jgi:hypothetical protein
MEKKGLLVYDALQPLDSFLTFSYMAVFYKDKEMIHNFCIQT